MSLFRKKHNTTVYNADFGQWNFVCSCGKTGKPLWTPTEAEAEAKARAHRESQARR